MKYLIGGFIAVVTLVATCFTQVESASAKTVRDGFYKAGGKYYYVVNGYRARIRRGNTYRTLLKVAQKGGVTPISEAGVQAIDTLDCDWDNPYYRLDPSLQTECENRLRIGEQLREKLSGKLLLEVDNNGSLVYIPKVSGEYPRVTVGTSFFEQSMYQYAKSQAQRVKKKRILRLTKWRTVDSLR